MLNGVAVDPLTEQFLGVATDEGRGSEVYGALRVFFHDARNRLNSLKIGLYLAKRSCSGPQASVWSELEQSYRGLEQLVERLQDICRPSRIDPVSGNLGPWLEERRQTWEDWLSARGRRLDWAPPDAAAIGRFDPLRLVRGLDALIAWRAAEGKADDPARLAWSADSTGLRVVWSEDADRGEGLLEGRDSRAISMALPLLARVMTAHDGTIQVERGGGFHVRLEWPTASVSLAEST